MEQFIREKIKDKPLNKKDLQKSRHSSTCRWHLQWLQALFLLYFCRLSTDNQKSFRWKNNNDVQIATQQPGIDDSNDAYSRNGTQRHRVPDTFVTEPFFDRPIEPTTRRLNRQVTDSSTRRGPLRPTVNLSRSRRV